MKVHIVPSLPSGADPGDGGIRQVVRAQYRWLPEFGWEIADSPADADVLACHVEIPPTYLRLYAHKPIVVHNHGAYWTPDYAWDGDWHYAANMRLLEALRVADITTAVSEWTAHTLRRHSNRDIRVVHHGVDLEEWTPLPDAERSDFVLWNKTRIDPVCDPTPVALLARALPNVGFVTTFLPAGEQPLRNVSMTGTLPFDESKSLIRAAGVYLCTTRETFGIGTLEALACGVPVVGYRWGGQREIVEHGVDGWLVEPGDITGLADGIRWALGNVEAQQAARRKAEQFRVRDSVAKYAAVYEEALARRQQAAENPRASVIVTTYKLAEYLPACLDSVAAQSDPDWECIVVDDASPDESSVIAEEYVRRDSRFRLIRNDENQYLAGARNTGIAAARGRYILPLDADDMLAPNAVRLLAEPLDKYRGVHITYGNVRFVDEDGVTPTRYATGKEPGHSGWPVDFRLDWMLLRPGQPLPYASMFRREAWELTGGYRTRCRSSEDCDFWLRTTSYGFVPQMVTQADTLIYRNRAGSMSRDVGWEEHRGWYPWVREHGTLPAAAYRGTVEGANVPFPALDAEIAVVIPVGPGHAKYVHDAVDSVDAQTFRRWECIVVNDSGEELPPLPQWVRIVERACCEHPSDVHLPGGGCAECPLDEYEHDYGLGVFGGVAAARNAGIAAATAPLYLPLDADDYLQPAALALMLAAHRDSGELRSIVYSDFYDEITRGEPAPVYQCADYNPRTLRTRGLPRAVTALTPVDYWRAVGGYDESLPAWEDWAFAISCAALGFCERRVAAPLFTYRKWTGARRESNLADFERSKAAMMAKDFGTNGGELMACGSCPGGRSTTFAGVGGSGARSMLASAPAANEDGLVMVEYTGAKAGVVQFASSVRGQSPYRFSASQRSGLVRSEDIEFFARNRDFRLVQPGEMPAGVSSAVGAPSLIAAGPPRTPQAPGAAGLLAQTPPVDDDGFVPMPTLPTPPPAAQAAPQPEALPPGVPANDLSVVRRAASESRQNAAESETAAEVTALARESRDTLDAQARELGIDPAAFRTKNDLARAIIGVRRARGADSAAD